MKTEAERLKNVAESWNPAHSSPLGFRHVRGLRSRFHRPSVAEGMVLIDMASRMRTKFRLFTLDTEFLFPETYNLMDRVEQRYGLTIERVFAWNSAEEQERVHGPQLWLRNADQCCNLRKVEPLRRKLGELQAWITSIRRDQTRRPRICRED